MSAHEDMLAELDRSDAERARDGVHTPADPALVDEAESGECVKCGRDFLYVADALAHVTTRPCLPEDVARHEAYLLRVVAGQLSPFDEPLGLA